MHHLTVPAIRTPCPVVRITNVQSVLWRSRSAPRRRKPSVLAFPAFPLRRFLEAFGAFLGQSLSARSRGTVMSHIRRISFALTPYVALRLGPFGPFAAPLASR